jgi:hypothetical protein
MLLVFAPASRRGDAVVLDDSLRHEVLTTWTTEQGFPQNFIRATAQTARGFHQARIVWCCCKDALIALSGEP